MYRIPQDVVTRKTIRRIPVPERRGRGRLDYPTTNLDENDYLIEENLPVSNNSVNPNKKKKNYLIWVVGGVSTIFLLFVAFGMWTKAYVEVVPKNELVNFSIPFNYSINKTVAQGDNSSNLAQLITTSKKISRQINATRTENVKKKASGVVTLYNTGGTTVKIVNSSRLQTKSGLTFRITSTVSVPPSTGPKSARVPGTIDVVAEADVAGEKFNIGKSDFTIPGFIGSSKYTEVYAKSKTDMAGGYVGDIKTVEESVMKSAREEMRNELRKQIRDEIYKNKSDDLLIYDSGIIYSFLSSTPNKTTAQNVVELVEEGTGKAVAFSRKDVEQSILKNSISSYSGEAVVMSGIEDAKVSFGNSDPVGASLNDIVKAQFTGSTLITWNIDENSLLSALAGKRKDDVSLVKSRFESIKNLSYNLKPFWKNAFPKNQNSIEIRVINDTGIDE